MTLTWIGVRGAVGGRDPFLDCRTIVALAIQLPLEVISQDLKCLLQKNAPFGRRKEASRGLNWRV